MTTPRLDVERAAIGWRIAQAGDEQNAADFAYKHMDDILAEVQQLRDRLALAEQRFETTANSLAAARQFADDYQRQAETLAAQLTLAEQALVDAGRHEDRLRAVVDAARQINPSLYRGGVITQLKAALQRLDADTTTPTEVG